MANSRKWQKIEIEASNGKVNATNYVNSIKISDAETSTEFITMPYIKKRVAEITTNEKVYLFEFNDSDMSAKPLYSAETGNIIIPPQLEVRDIDGNSRIITGVEKDKS